MRQFAVGYINFYDNELTVEIVEADTEQEARWKHSKNDPTGWGDISGTDLMDRKEFKEWCFDCDMMVDVIEISQDST